MDLVALFPNDWAFSVVMRKISSQGKSSEISMLIMICNSFKKSFVKVIKF